MCLPAYYLFPCPPPLRVSPELRSALLLVGFPSWLCPPVFLNMVWTLEALPNTCGYIIPSDVSPLILKPKLILNLRLLINQTSLHSV